MKLFDTWSRDRIVEAIENLEVNMAQGIQSVSNPSQGSVGYSSIENAFTVLRSLKARLAEIDGTKPVRSGPRAFGQRITGGCI